MIIGKKKTPHCNAQYKQIVKRFMIWNSDIPLKDILIYCQNVYFISIPKVCKHTGDYRKLVLVHLYSAAHRNVQ